MTTDQATLAAIRARRLGTIQGQSRSIKGQSLALVQDAIQLIEHELRLAGLTALPPRTPETDAADAQLDEIGRDVQEGRVAPDRLTAAIDHFVTTWRRRIFAAGVDRRPT